ncbi:DUF421 domain-containing protein [Rhodobacterales bacterium]|nr:DUF421 domain-containing protein [Rhodobacterales bacterium]
MDATVEAAALRGLVFSVTGLCTVILLVRFNGLRSFSKMTSYDFVMTLATGSLLAALVQADTWSSVSQVVFGLAGLFIIQHLIARLQVFSPSFDEAISNAPLMIVRNGEIDLRAMHSIRMSKASLFSKLRGANVSDLSNVRAVVVETTGDVSVIQGSKSAESVLRGVETGADMDAKQPDA